MNEFETNSYYINGYRISARSYGQALESARQLKRGSYPFDWPGEKDHVPSDNRI